MQLSKRGLAGSFAVVAAVAISPALAGSYGAKPYGAGYGPGAGYGAPYGGPPMGYPQRPQRPMPPARPMPPKMGGPYGYHKGMGYGYGPRNHGMRSGYGMPHGSGPQPTQGVPTTTAPAEAAESASVTISQMRFNAPSITVKAGGTVTWTNSESTPHTVTADDGSFGSSQLTTGDTFSIQFDEPGTYTYYCQYHPSMRATVVVVA